MEAQQPHGRGRLFQLAHPLAPANRSDQTTGPYEAPAQLQRNRERSQGPANGSREALPHAFLMGHFFCPPVPALNSKAEYICECTHCLNLLPRRIEQHPLAFRVTQREHKSGQATSGPDVNPSFTRADGKHIGERNTLLNMASEYVLAVSTAHQVVW
jgi:hypothetical protein